MLVVVVHYRTPDVLIDCLRALSGEVAAVPGTRVTVVDNASGDDAVLRIRESIAAHGWQDWVTLVEQAHNSGYAAGNNYVLRTELRREDPPDYIWLLNPDTRVQPGALAALVGLLMRKPLAGLAGSLLVDTDGSAQASAFRFPTLGSELDEGLRLGFVSNWMVSRRLALPTMQEAGQVAWVPATSVLVRRKAFEAVGVLDEGFFLYFEDVDLCRRAGQSGWECWHVPNSRVIHLHGRSGDSAAGGRWHHCIAGHWLASRRRYWLKHHSRAHAALADVCWIGGLALWQVRRFLLRTRDTDPPGFLGQAIRHSALLARWPEARAGRS